MYFCIACRTPHKKETSVIIFKELARFGDVVLPMGICKQDVSKLITNDNESTHNRKSA